MQASSTSLQHDPSSSNPNQPGLPTGPTHVAFRSTRTPEQVESNRVFMAAAGRVEFGRYEATQRAVWIAFAYFASLGVERICYAAVEHVAERAKVSGRTVRRHIPALIERGRIYAENRVGGRTPAVWKVILPDEAMSNRGRTACPARADNVSGDIRDLGKYRAAPPSRGQARPCVKRVKSGSSPVTTAAPLKGSPVPSPSPLRVIARPDQYQPHIEAMREIAQRTTSRTQEPSDGQKGVPSISAIPDPLPAPSPEQRAAALALFAAVDAGIDEAAEAAMLTNMDAPIARTGGGIIGGGYTGGTPDTCPRCGYDRIYNGGCESCGADLRDFGDDFNYGH